MSWIRASILGLALLGAGTYTAHAADTARVIGTPHLVSDRTTPAEDTSRGADNFYQSTQLDGQTVSFNSQYNLRIAGNLFLPKNRKAGEKLPAIIVGHPMGATKEQSASLYAQKMAEQGYATLAIDLPYYGQSEGTPRNLVDLDAFTEAFSAAVDYLGTRDFVDRDRIGIIGICSSGSFVINAAKIDPRLKAIATVSMYDMGAAARNGLRHSFTLAQRKALLEEAAQQRYVEFEGGAPKYTSGTVNELPPNADPVSREFYDFYRTSRGSYTTPGDNPENTTHSTLTSYAKFMNFYPFNDIDTISPRPLLFIAGDHAHSLEFSEDAYRLAKEPKELYLVPNAGHVDLYDRTDIIPFAKLTAFFNQYLK